MRRTLLILTAILLAFLVVSCKSNRIPSESKNKALLTSKNELSEAVSEAVKKQPVSTYYAKNAQASVRFGGSSHTLKVNLFFDYGKETVGVARLSFPPVSVGKVRMNDRTVSVNSSIAGIKKDFNLPLNVNTYLHDALLGRIPKICTLFGDDDYSSFEMSINKDDRYVLHKKKNGMDATIEINPDFNLHSYVISYLQYQVEHVNVSFDTYDGRVLPNKIDLNVKLPGQDGVVQTEIELPKIAIDGKDRLD